jgi:hypothetical protein
LYQSELEAGEGLNMGDGVEDKEAARGFSHPGLCHWSAVALVRGWRSGDTRELLRDALSGD